MTRTQVIDVSPTTRTHGRSRYPSNFDVFPVVTLRSAAKHFGARKCTEELATTSPRSPVLRVGSISNKFVFENGNPYPLNTKAPVVMQIIQ
jgi:hypothetical protein